MDACTSCKTDIDDAKAERQKIMRSVARSQPARSSSDWTKRLVSSPFATPKELAKIRAEDKPQAIPVDDAREAMLVRVSSARRASYVFQHDRLPVLPLRRIPIAMDLFEGRNLPSAADNRS
jgi:hypothetical protein